MSELEGQHEHPSEHGDKGDKGAKGDKGDSGDSPTAELLAAVLLLVKEVEALYNRLSKDYPSREEVRHEGRKRAAKSLAFAFVIIIISNFITIQTVSYCFLSPVGTVHSVCNRIPGYENTVTQGNQRLRKFNLLLTQIVSNQKSIIDLQQRVAVLEGQG
jgi:hypothetical protein